MSEYRRVIEHQGRELTIDVLANQRLCGKGIQGRKLVKAMNKILPYYNQITLSSGEYRGGSTIIQAVANTALDQLESKEELGSTKLRTATPEDLIGANIGSLLDETWYDLGIIWWGEEGTNSSQARDLEIQLKSNTSKIIEPPLLLYGLRAEKDNNKEYGVRLIFEPNKSKVVNARGLRDIKGLTRKIQTLEDILKGNRVSQDEEGIYFSDTERTTDIALQPLTYGYGAVSIRGPSLSEAGNITDRNRYDRKADKGRLILVAESQKD